MGNSRTFHGCCFFADVNADGSLVDGKWFEVGEAYPLSLKLGADVVQILGNTCLTAGKVIGSKEKPVAAEGSLTLFDYLAKNVARSLRAMVSTRAVSPSTLTDQAVTLAGFGEFVEIGTEDLSSVVVKDATDTTTYTVDVDYRINAVLGLIAPLSGGAIAEDAVVHVSAAGAGNTDQRLTIGAGSTQKVAIKINLVDDFDQSTGKLYLRKVLLVANNEAVLLSDPDTEREQLDFTLTPEIPTGQNDYGTLDGLPL